MKSNASNTGYISIGQIQEQQSNRSNHQSVQDGPRPISESNIHLPSEASQSRHTISHSSEKQSNSQKNEQRLDKVSSFTSYQIN